MHTQGERAVQLALDAAEAVLETDPWDDHRQRLEHNALITVEQIQRAKALGFKLRFFTDHIYYYGDRLPELVGDRVSGGSPRHDSQRQPDDPDGPAPCDADVDAPDSTKGG